MTAVGGSSDPGVLIERHRSPYRPTLEARQRAEDPVPIRAARTLGHAAIAGATVAAFSVPLMATLSSSLGRGGRLGIAAGLLTAAVAALPVSHFLMFRPQPGSPLGTDTPRLPPVSTGGDPNGGHDEMAVPAGDGRQVGEIVMRTDYTYLSLAMRGTRTSEDGTVEHARAYDRLEDAVAFARQRPGDQVVVDARDTTHHEENRAGRRGDLYVQPEGRWLVGDSVVRGRSGLLSPDGTESPVDRSIPTAEWLASTDYGFEQVRFEENDFGRTAARFLEFGGAELYHSGSHDTWGPYVAARDGGGAP